MPTRHRIFIAAIAMFASLALVLPSGGLSAPDAARGRQLYETRCHECHDRSVHARAKREARDYGQVRAWVERWNANLGLAWSAEELDDVAAYLNSTYYRFPCPAGSCPERS